MFSYAWVGALKRFAMVFLYAGAAGLLAYLPAHLHLLDLPDWVFAIFGSVIAAVVAAAQKWVKERLKELNAVTDTLAAPAALTTIETRLADTVDAALDRWLVNKNDRTNSTDPIEVAKTSF